MQILFDTNIVSEFVRPTPNPDVVAWGQQFQSVAVSVVTLEEIAYGLTAKPNQRVQTWLDQFFTTYCSVLPITEEVAQIAGRLRGTLRKQGKPRTQADMMIAATARWYELTLATRNVRDFEDCDIALINPFS